MSRNEDGEKKFNGEGSMGVPLFDAQAAMFHGIDDVFFHQSAGDAQAFGDLQMAQAIELAQQETLAADRRQFGQSALKQFQTLGLIVTGVGRAGGEAGDAHPDAAGEEGRLADGVGGERRIEV